MVPAQARVARRSPRGLRGPGVLVFLTTALLLAVPLLGAAPAAAVRLCLLPAQLPFPEDDERRDRLEQLVIRRFEAASIAVTPSREVRALLEQVDERSGAIFDPATGRIDAARDAVFREDVAKSVASAFGCTGFLQLSLAIVQAYYNGVSANWDGQSVRVNSGGRIAARAFASVLIGAYISEEGWVPALSLWIRVTDLRERDRAFRSAGIEPIMDFSYSRGDDLLPEDRWLRDEERLEEALDSALGPELGLLKADTLPPAGPEEETFRWE